MATVAKLTVSNATQLDAANWVTSRDVFGPRLIPPPAYNRVAAQLISDLKDSRMPGRDERNPSGQTAFPWNYCSNTMTGKRHLVSVHIHYGCANASEISMKNALWHGCYC